MLLAILALVCATGALAGDNTGSYARTVCRPDQNTADGEFYCTNYFDGWYSGGAQTGDFVQQDGPRCYKAGVGSCQCPDCGYNGFPDVQCKDWRCDDDDAFFDTATGSCYTIDASTGRRNTVGTSDHAGCYKQRAACDRTICALGQQLVNCKRYSPGACIDCADKPVIGEKYYRAKGYCDTLACSQVNAGQFVQAACTLTHDTVIIDCSAYPGNPLSPVPSGQPKYYCPGKGLVLPLPAFSQPTADYSDFVCVDGYYLVQGACQQCPQGSACRYGRKFLCPENYFQHQFAGTDCGRCTYDCNNGEAPYRCLQGSTTDVGCVSCGMCGYSLNTGHLCNEEPQAMAILKATCVPKDLPGAVAQCA